MKRLLLIGLPIVAVFIGLPILALAVITTSTTAGADCRPRQQEATTSVGDPSRLGDLGVIDGPVGGPVEGKISVASANIPNRSGLQGFRSSMREVLSTNADFVTLNEVSARSIAQIEATAPGYRAYRDQRRPPGPGGEQAMGNVVLWRNDTWTKRNAGRVKIVEDDQAIFKGRPVTWDRYATWALLERKSDGAVVSIISVHHMTNPHRFPRQHGTPPLSRSQQYGQGMDIVLKLANSLATHGPVLIGGDMNSHASYTDLSWSAAAKMSAAGYGWYHHAVDFLFFPRYQGMKLDQGSTGPMDSDHQWVAARLDMNGAGPTVAPDDTTPAAATDSTTTDTVPGAAPAAGVRAQLMRLRFAEGSPTITAEQADNAIAIARVARDLNVPRRGLAVAIATAIQESKLINLPGGDRDSGGLFQQRPSSGWGTRGQITTPRLAARAFFGRAKHTHNPGLLDIPGWEQMPLAKAAQAVQDSGHSDAFAPWEPIAQEIADLLGGDLPDVPAGTASVGEDCEPAGSTTGCTVAESRYNLGPVKPQLTRLVNTLGPMFNIDTVGGYRADATDPNGHPAGLAADFMVPLTPAGKAQGDELVAFAQQHAKELGIDYIIWYQRIWSVQRAAEGWRPMPDRGSLTANHMNHPHIQALPDPTSGSNRGSRGAPATRCGEVMHPMPAQYIDNDAHNWHDSGSHWTSWHSGTDFAAPCRTPVYAAHGGTIEIDTTRAWSGPWLVKVATGPGSLTTWYAHMQAITVSRGETVQPGQQIGEVGDEGNSEGCHLHFEVHLKNGPIYGPDNVNPSQWLAEHAHRRPAVRG